MSGDDFGRIAYLVLLLIAVGGWFVAEARHNLGKSVRQALIWGFIFLGLIAGFGLWEDVRREIAPRQMVSGDGRIEVPMGDNGHYHLTVRANGKPLDFLIDTGASSIVLSKADAQSVGIATDDLSYLYRVETANGTVLAAGTTLDELELEGVVDRDVRILVNSGDMDGSVLGMDYLNRFQRVEIRRGVLVLER